MVYTDGSVKTNDTVPLHFKDPRPIQTLASSIVFPSHRGIVNKWTDEHVIALRITATNASTQVSGYTMELLPAAIVTQLAEDTQVHLVTDCHSLQTIHQKAHLATYPGEVYDTSSYPRNGTDNGILLKTIVGHSPNLSLEWIPAHKQDLPSSKTTINGTGNQIADLIAKGRFTEAHQLVGKLTVIECSLAEILVSETHHAPPFRRT